MSLTSIVLGLSPYTPPVGMLRTVTDMPASRAGETISPERRAVLDAVEADYIYSDAIAEYLGVSQQSVAHHLKLLSEAGYIQWTKVGKKFAYHTAGHFNAPAPEGAPSVERHRAVLGTEPFTAEDLHAVGILTPKSAGSTLARWVKYGHVKRIGRINNGRKVWFKFEDKNEG